MLHMWSRRFVKWYARDLDTDCDLGFITIYMLTHEYYNTYDIHMLQHEHLLMIQLLIHSWFLMMQTDI